MGKKNKYRKPTVPQERLVELRRAIEAGEVLQNLSDEEFQGLANHLAEAASVDALVTLAGLASAKAQRKAVNQALFRLKQRGVEVPDLKARRAPVRIAASDSDITDLPVFMSPPHGNSTRIFFLPYASGRSLWFVQAHLSEPVGLTKLVGEITTKSLYRTIIGRLGRLSTAMEDSPEFTSVGYDIAPRKLWEIGQCVRAGRVGPEVDRELYGLLSIPQQAPPHPAESLSFEGVGTRTMAELDDLRWVLAAFLHERIFLELEKVVNELESGVLVLTDAQREERVAELQDKLVTKWVEEWGVRRIIEVLLDCVLFHDKRADRQTAHTLWRVTQAPNEEVRDRQVRRFLNQIITQMRLGRSGAPEDEGEERSPGGIILP